MTHYLDDVAKHAGKAGYWAACADCGVVGWVTVELDMERERCRECRREHALWEALLHEVALEKVPPEALEESIETLGEHLKTCRPCGRLLEQYEGG